MFFFQPKSRKEFDKKSLPTVRVIVDIALAMTSFDEAMQVYLPESSCLESQIRSVPFTLTFDLPKGSGPFSFLHVTVGC